MSTITTTGNEATLNLISSIGVYKQLTLSSNSSREQIMRVELDDDRERAMEYRFTGEGTVGRILNLPPTTRKVVLAFSHQADGKQKPSELKVGGPYLFGSVQTGIIVAENGDDQDFNDALAQLLVK